MFVVNVNILCIFRDLGAMDTDSNYFSGGETERGESKLSNYTDRKLSDSSSCSDNSCLGTKLSGDANYFSDSNFSDSYSVTTERRHIYECRYLETSRRVERNYRGQNGGQSANSSPAAVRESAVIHNCDRKAAYCAWFLIWIFAHGLNPFPRSSNPLTTQDIF